MKTGLQFLSVFILCTLLNGFAYADMVSKPAYGHLLEVNAQWKNYPDAVPDPVPHFVCDNQRIRFHLQAVEKHLRTHTPQNLDDRAFRNRMALLDVLHGYHERAIFPTNTRHDKRQPYFIDDHGVYCAVGYLISRSGHDALAQEIHRKQNYAYIKEITVEGIAEWATTHGFTIDELAWIQPAYLPGTSFAPLGGGTDGPVTKMAFIPSGMAFAGTFSHLGVEPCAGVGYYKNNQLACYGNGLDGVVNGLAYDYSGQVLYAVGKFGHNGNTYPLAYYDETGWSYVAFSQQPDVTGTAMLINGSVLDVVFTSPAFSGSEIWRRENGIWTKRAGVDGVVHCIVPTSVGRAYAGAFASLTVYPGNTTLPAQNLAFDDTGNWSAVSGPVSDTIKVARYIGGALYLGGSCSDNGSEVCLTRYLNGTLQPLVTTAWFGTVGSFSINAIDLYASNKLLLGGDFSIYPMIGTFGNSLATYDLTYNGLQAMSVLDGGVNAFLQTGGIWYVGGGFTQNAGTSGLNHLAQLLSPQASVDEPGTDNPLSVYPNPATDRIHVASPDNMQLSSIRILDITGKEVAAYVPKNSQANHQLDVSTFTPGMYVMWVETVAGTTAQAKFLVSR